MFVSVCSAISAQTVDVDVAMQKAMQLRQSKKRNVLSLLYAKPQLAYTSQDSDNVYYYVFNYPNGGFAIIGGSEQASELLGYCERGEFDIDKIPEAMKDMLSAYNDQIKAAIEAERNSPSLISIPNSLDGHNAETDMPSMAKSIGSVSPMLTTEWGQDEPFYNFIPSLGSDYKHNVVGCGATAAAQVMKYYEYPVRGTGSNSYSINYSTDDGVVPISYEADFTKAFDWSNMLDVYYGVSAKAAQKSAVADLMYRVGVAMNMYYNGTNSSSSTTSAGTALTKYFGYSKAAKVEYRKYYADAEWESIIRSELSEGHPIIYSGQSSNGGHAFVVHGYDATNDTYAINWGWEGYCDGYFPLTGSGALKPLGSGTGGAGASASYISQQAAYIGLCPDPSAGDAASMQLAVNDELVFPSSVYTKTVDRNSTGDATFSLGAPEVINIGINSAAIDFGIMFEDESMDYRVYKKVFSTTVAPLYIVSKAISFYSSLIPYNGTYNIYAVVRPQGSGDDAWVKAYTLPDNKVPQLIIKNGVNYKPADIAFSINAKEVAVGKTLRISYDANYTGTAKYTSSNSSVASVSSTGVVTGKSVGSAVIYAEGTATSQFNATKTQFLVTVVDKVLKPLTIKVSSTSLEVLKTASITANSDYDGEMTFSSSDNSVATVSSAGTITAVSAGTAYITAVAPATSLYKATAVTFLVTVSESSSAESGVVLARQPYTDNANHPTATDLLVHVSLKNYSTTTEVGAYCYYSIAVGSQIATGGTGYATIGGGAELSFDIDLRWLAPYLTPGSKYTVRFYKDNSYSTSYNYKSMVFTYCDTENITYTQNAGEYGTLILPFEAKVPKGLTAYTLAGYSGSEATLSSVDVMLRNTPYVLQGTAGSYSFSGPSYKVEKDIYSTGIFVGVMGESVTYPSSCYTLSKRNGRSCFVSLDKAGQHAPQYSAYFNPPAGYAESFLKLPLLDGEVETLTTKGDVNNDGKVNIADVAALVSIILGRSSDTYNAADVSGDGVVNINDVHSLVKLVLSE